MKILVMLFLGYVLAEDTSKEYSTEESSTEESSEEYKTYDFELLPFISCNEDKDCKSRCLHWEQGNIGGRMKDVKWTQKDCANLTFCDQKPKQEKKKPKGEGVIEGLKKKFLRMLKKKKFLRVKEEVPDWVPKVEKGVCNDRKMCDDGSSWGLTPRDCPTKMARDYIQKNGPEMWNRVAFQKCIGIGPAARCMWDGEIIDSSSTGTQK